MPFNSGYFLQTHDRLMVAIQEGCHIAIGPSGHDPIAFEARLTEGTQAYVYSAPTILDVCAHVLSMRERAHRARLRYPAG